MKTRTLTVGSLKTKTKITSDDKGIQETVLFEPERKRPKKVTNNIELMQNNKFYTVIPGSKKSSLLDLALLQNQLLTYKCKKGSCGKCKVKVLSGGACLDGVTNMERKKLKNDLELNYRLSCQAVVSCNN